MFSRFFSFKMIKMNFNIFWFLITAPILIFTDLLMSILYSLLIILHIAKQKQKIKKNTLSRLKTNAILFIYTHGLQEQDFWINLIASELLMLWIIKRESTFSTGIIAISLIIRYKIVKSWQPRHTESWHLNLRLKNQ